MRVWVYKSGRKNGCYIYVSGENDFSDVPAKLLTALGDLEYALDLELQADRKLASENAETVLENIRQHGYHLQINDPLLYGKLPSQP